MRFRELLSRIRLSCEARPPRAKAYHAIVLVPKWKKLLKENAQFQVYESREFVVFISKNFGVRWQYDLPDLSESEKTELDNLLTEATIINALPTGGLNYEHLLRFKTLIGQACVCGFSGQYPNGSRILQFAREYLRDRTQEVSRFWYLSSSIIFSIPPAIAALIFWLARDTLRPCLGEGLFWLVIAACCGAFGALLSVMSRTGKLAFDSSSGRCLHGLEALSRISVGALSGGIVALAIQSGYFIPSFTSLKTHALILLAAIAAGASERLAPSIISQFDRKAVRQSHECRDTNHDASQQTIPADQTTATRSRRRPGRARRVT